jgi:hypothetical protein
MQDKKYISEVNKRYRKKYPWKRCWLNINTRCNNPLSENYKWYGAKGIKNLLSVEDVKFLWFRDKAYEMKRPSIDRKDNNNYSLENCRFIEQSENSIKANKLSKNKIVLQFDLQGKLIKEWESITKASIYYNTSIQNISSNLRNKSASACNFIWKLKKK